ncbi:murein biosynthesis integral membrane protein MurJ [Youngiibacter multivorans]|uniref:Probable lipid II flippase MurJ n=1 Tax=Youngiibacter multivorans TaxID=937251 RepID=A0ABS4G9F0_9CLOT|nr:murein biosynthesis integral membrane protein MurJ [Youngiibacter multivorans]MBP1920900.1 putative peptidoglycan lipid II flippase [Youngiibacter multivorans]
MKKTVAAVMIITILSKLLGFLREVSLSFFFGASEITDAFNIAQTIPTSIFSFIWIALFTSFIPIYNRIRAERSSEHADLFTSNLLSVIIMMCALLAITIIIFAVPVVRLFASGFSEETLKLAASLTRISIAGIVISAVIYILTAMLQIRDSFIVPALIGIPANLVAIASYALAGSNSSILAIGIILGLALQAIFLAAAAKKAGFRYTRTLKLHDSNIRELLLFSIPVIIGVSVNQVNVLVDKTIASGIAVGGISALGYAQVVNGFVQGIFVEPVSSVMYPTISRMASEGDRDALSKTLSNAIVYVLMMILPAMTGILVLSGPITRLIFQRGAFGAEAAILTSSALFFYAIGHGAYAIRDLFSRTFYALGDTRTPMRNSIFGMVLNIILNIVLSRYLGIGGLALATSISAIATSSALVVSFRKKTAFSAISGRIKNIVRIAAASAIMGAVVWFAYGLIIEILNPNVSALVSIAVGIITYVILVLVLKVEEARSAVFVIHDKLRKTYGK